jgi:hypothetical protein
MDFNSWMKKEYGFTWDEHRTILLLEGYQYSDVLDEFFSLYGNWRDLI